MKDFLLSKKGLIITSASAAALLVLTVLIVVLSLRKKEPEAKPVIVSSVESVPSASSAPEEIKLVITSHSKLDTTTTESITSFVGTSDPAFPLLVNGEEVERDPNGAFAFEKELTIGQNKFTFSHKGEEVTYIVRYRYVVIKAYIPSGKQTYDSGSAFSVTVNARNGSVVTATFSGKTITLNKVITQKEDVSETPFVDYTGSFSLPDGNTSNLNLGKVIFSASYKEYSETYRSGDIICKKANIPVVGEIVSFSAETFDGDGTNGLSKPINNYLPAGTVDYITGTAYSGDLKYYRLRYGKSVLATKELKPGNKEVIVTREYAGTLPDTNKLSVASVEESKRFTTIAFDTEWKAPFTFSLLPQTYKNPSVRDFTVTAVTCQYVEIKFCYANAINGDITFKSNNTLFTHAEKVNGGTDGVLRLYLKRTGQFYGWDAYYNSNGQLEFKFLHPAPTSPGDNEYGIDLSGVRIMLDVGHGGIDSGAVGVGNLLEKERNMNIALKLKTELEKMGATVQLNRTTDKTVDSDERCKILKAAKPDLCIAIHHDSNTSIKPNGFGAFHNTLFSSLPTKFIYEETIKTGIYNASAQNNRNRLEWHYYYVARMTDCPVVLTENGFMSSNVDAPSIASDAANLTKAKAIAKGVARYFKEIDIEYIEEPVSSQLPSTPESSSSKEESSSDVTSQTPPAEEDTETSSKVDSDIPKKDDEETLDNQ